MKRLVVLLLVANGAWAQGSPERGHAVFLKMGCDACHGTLGQGGERGAGPKLAPNPFPYEAFAFQVRRPRANMPRYPQEFLSDAQLADIYAYIGSIKPGPGAKEIPLLRPD
jgi:mono/diheme cytochrome c family protein